MALDPEKLEKPFRKLRKSLRKLPKQPSPEEVHDLRTRTRRVEATLHALLLDQKRKGRRVLSAVTPLRKHAGKVRDMDVLIGLVSSLNSEADSQCRLHLVEYLSQERFAGARNLHKAAAKRRGTARHLLKRCSSFIERGYDGDKESRRWPADAAAIALQLCSELRDWPKLTASNLHPFRLKAKQLRYVLELSGRSNEVLEMLNQVQDTIGDWHNWTELTAIAKDVLRHSGPCHILEQIDSRTQRHLDQALAMANRLRNRYFAKPSRRGKRTSPRPSTRQSVLETTAKLAA